MFKRTTAHARAHAHIHKRFRPMNRASCWKHVLFYYVYGSSYLTSTLSLIDLEYTYKYHVFDMHTKLNGEIAT